MRLIAVPSSLELVSVRVFHLALSVCSAMFPLPIVEGPVSPGHLAAALSEASAHLALVSRPRTTIGESCKLQVAVLTIDPDSTDSLPILEVCEVLLVAATLERGSLLSNLEPAPESLDLGYQDTKLPDLSLSLENPLHSFTHFRLHLHLCLYQLRSQVQPRRHRP